MEGGMRYLEVGILQVAEQNNVLAKKQVLITISTPQARHNLALFFSQVHFQYVQIIGLLVCVYFDNLANSIQQLDIDINI